MKCRFCGETFRLTKYHKDQASCPDCSGITDDFTINDEEMKIDILHLKNPSGRTQPVFPSDDLAYDDDYDGRQV